MPTIPEIRNLDANSVQILNAIRNSASTNYQDYIPEATSTTESIREIGSVIMEYPALQNEFLNALINRIGRVILTSKMYTNPWASFKRGMLEFGEVVEEVFVKIALPANYDPSTAENQVFKRKIPDVKSAFHVLNYKQFYKVTIENAQLRQAFLSWAGITDLIAHIVDSMYSAANYDEFQTMKLMLARGILNGFLKPAQINLENLKSTVSTIKGVSNAIEFMSNKYNLAGVPTFTKKDNQYLIVNSTFDADIDVEVLATAFNMDKANFMGHRVLVDGFGELDADRLELLFPELKTADAFGANGEFSPTVLAALNAVSAVLVDETWFMIFDNLYEFTEQYNGEGLYWNYWYHVWKTFSMSPFANAIVFVSGAPSVTSVDVTPATAIAIAGQNVQFEATVITANYASKAVDWSVSAVDGNDTAINVATAGIVISPTGKLTIPSTVETGTVITVTATSVDDTTTPGTKATDTATVTVGIITEGGSNSETPSSP